MEFLAILCIPVIICWISKVVWARDITWGELGASVFISALITAAVLAMGMYSATSDVEVLSGQVTGKTRTEGTYLESYSCHCRRDSKGNNHCQTCHRRHYTVHWDAQSTLGEFGIKSLDSTSSTVYLSSDPDRYTITKVGDPVSKTSSFTNYVKAVPQSLFHFTGIKPAFADKIPEYPSNIYDIYKIDRVLTVGVPLRDYREWNDDVSNMLRTLGPSKEANVVVVFVNTADQSYLYSLRSAWLNGKKNDVIVVIGTSKYPTIDWVGVLSWTDNELFKVQLRDDVFNLKTVDRPAIIEVISQNVKKTFKRKDFHDFDSLQNEIDPPLWVAILAIVLSVLISGGLSWHFYKNETF